MPARWLILVTIVLLGLPGCGSSTDQKETSASSPPAGGPADAVREFLHAVQTGDDQKAGDMLTTLARQKTSELDLEVAPPGSETATFDVGDVEMVGDDGAYVGSVWTDNDPEGKPRSDQIVWVVRKDPEGWRIAGMVTKLFESKLVLNFEDPADMLRKQELAAEELEKRAKAEQQQAQQPAEGDKTLK